MVIDVAIADEFFRGLIFTQLSLQLPNLYDVCARVCVGIYPVPKNRMAENSEYSIVKNRGVHHLLNNR